MVSGQLNKTELIYQNEEEDHLLGGRGIWEYLTFDEL
jgi:hypothetical protein